ncbi:MAG: hypothetical protein ACJ760_07145 [Thermoleophilaceae bacterium]
MQGRAENAERVFIDAHGVDDDAVKRGFRWLFAFSQEHDCPRAAVVVPGVPNIANLGRVLGEQNATRLQKNRELSANGVVLVAYTDRTLPFDLDGVPVLAVWVDDKQLRKIDGLSAAAICAIPWTSDGITEWTANWNPTDLRTGEAGGPEQTVLNPVVVAGLTSLTDRVNLSTGLGHPSDKDSAIGLFKLLTGAGEDYDPNQIRAWAVQHGWEPDDAAELAELSGKIRAGRTVRGTGRQMWRDDIVELWREESG